MSHGPRVRVPRDCCSSARLHANAGHPAGPWRALGLAAVVMAFMSCAGAQFHVAVVGRRVHSGEPPATCAAVPFLIAVASGVLTLLTP